MVPTKRGTHATIGTAASSKGFQQMSLESGRFNSKPVVKDFLALAMWSIAVVQSPNPVWLIATPGTAAHQASLSFIISWSLLKLMFIEPVMPSNHLILFCPFSSCLQSFPASGSFPMSLHFASGGQCTGASISASVLPMNIQAWFPFRINSFYLFAVPGMLQSLLQHHNSKASILQCSAFFMIQFPGEGNGKPLQYSCLGNPMNRWAWQATVHGVARVGHNVVTIPLTPHHISTWLLEKP